MVEITQVRDRQGFQNLAGPSLLGFKSREENGDNS